MNNYNPPEYISKEFNERRSTKKQNLHDLIRWLEYGRKTGFEAARQSKEQEEFWADQLKMLFSIEGIIVKFIHPESDDEWCKYFETSKQFYEYWENINSDGLVEYQIVHSTIPETPKEK